MASGLPDILPFIFIADTFLIVSLLLVINYVAGSFWLIIRFQ